MEASSGFETDWNMNPTICRLCLHSDGFLLGIFNHLHGKEKNIYNKIIDCTALEISSGDGLPHTICHRCLFKLELCLDFRAQCFVSDSTLRQASRIAHAQQRATGNPNESNGQHAAQGFSLMDLVPPQPGDSGDVVVVVDPSAVDYDSDYDSKYGRAESNDHYHDQPSAMGKIVPNIGHYGHPMMMNHNANDGQGGPHDSQMPSDNETNEVADNGGDIYDFRNVFMCRYCDRAFTDKPQCTRHEAEEHDPSEPYSCKTCQLSFPDRLHYSAHLKSLHADDKPYDCPECEKMFARRSDLRKHTIVHTGIKPFTCPVCSKSFSRNTNLSKHMRIHAGHKPFVCPRCPKTFITRGDLQRHSLIHSGRKPFPCRYCNLSFSRRDKLLRHEKRHFPAGPSSDNVSHGAKFRRGGKNGDYSGENMVIDIDPIYTGHHESSGAPIDNSINVENRANSLDQQRPFDNTVPNLNDTVRDSNDEQNSRFSNRDMYTTNRDMYEKLHKKRKTQSVTSHVTGDDIEPEEEKEEQIKRELTALEKATKSKRYPCLQCHRRFSNMEGLKFHIQQHHNTTVNISGRPFPCSQCPKGFIRKRELDRHMTTHSGMKPFSCTSCDKRFGRKDKLVRHMRIHDGSNLHVCSICTLAFSRKDSLWQHMRNHHRQDQIQYRSTHHKPSELFNDSGVNIAEPIHEHQNITPTKEVHSAQTASVLRDYLEEETLSSSSNFEKVTADSANTTKRNDGALDLDSDFLETKIALEETNLSQVQQEKQSPVEFEDSLMTDKEDKLGNKEHNKERSSEFDEDDEEDDEYDEDRHTENSRTNIADLDDDLNEDKDMMDNQQQDENSNLENQNEQPNRGGPDYDNDLELDENDEEIGEEEDEDEDGGQQQAEDDQKLQQHHGNQQQRNKAGIIDCDVINDSADEENSSQYGGQQQQHFEDDFDDDNDEDDDDDDVQMTAAPRSVIL